ncbi:InlB B-repeat-containing protein [Coraliomargarita sp. W4R53]
MPVGIPEAPIDFLQEAPERPSDWSVEVPGYYYVDTQRGSYAPTYGTPSNPRKYMPTPTGLSAGSYIEIEGEYDHGLYINNSYIFRAVGTDEPWVANTSGPIWITKAEGADAAFTKLKLILTGENIFLTDMYFRDGARPQIGSPTDGYPAKNIVVRNVDVGGSFGGISINGNNADSASETIIVYNSSFHDCGDVNAIGDEDAHVITVNSYCSKVWLLDNTMHTASGAGLQILASAGNGHNTHNIYAGNNEVYNVRQSGMWVKTGKDIVFSGNHVHDIIDTSWSVSKGMGAQYEPDGFWMINNHIHGAKYGVRVPSTTGTDWRQQVYIIGNVIHDINALGETVGPIETPITSWQPAAIHLHGAHDHYIYNNLIFDAPNGIDTTGAGISRIRNNILLDVTESQADGQSGYDILAEIQDLNEEVFIDNNYFGAEMRVRARHGIYTTPASLNAIDGASGNVSGTDLISDANLSALLSATNISGGDFAALIDSGANVDAILVAEFASRFASLSAGIDSDISKALRKQGVGIDIGPFEQGGAIHSPVVSSTLRVNGGSRDGSYDVDSVVTITAATPANGYEFETWTGDVATIAALTSPTTTITVSKETVAVTAKYKAVAVVQYSLAVNNGSGDGDYTSGSIVTIVADAAPDGQVFDTWTGDVGAVAAAGSATTTLTIQADATVTATYKDAADVGYRLVVNHGTGDGEYDEGSVVTITADAAPTGQEFDAWTGGTAYLLSATNATTTVTIPAANVTLTATYKDLPDDGPTPAIVIERIETPFVIDLKGREFWAFKEDVHGNFEAGTAGIGEPVYTNGEGSLGSATSTDIQFVQGGVEQGSGYVSMDYNEANSCLIPLLGNGQQRTARIYMNVGIWTTADATFTVTAGEDVLVFELPANYSHLRYEVRVQFTDSVDVTIQPNGAFGGYSFFRVAGVVLDESTAGPVDPEPVGSLIFVDPLLAESYCDDYTPETRSAGSGDQVAYNSLAGAAAVATAGDIVEIRAGTYSNPLEPQNSGTVESPLTFRNYNDEAVTITGETMIPAITINDRSYLIIEGLTVSNVRRWMYALNAHHNVIRNNTFSGALDTDNSSKTGLYFEEATFNRIIDNVIHDSTADNLTLLMSDNNLVAGNTITEAGHTLWVIKGGNRNIIRDNYFSNSIQKIGEVYDCHNVGFSQKFTFPDATKFNVIERNTFAKTSDYYSTSGDNGIQYAGQNGIVRLNVFYDNNVGIGMQFYSNEALHNKYNRIYQNTFHENRSGGVATSSPNSAEYIDNVFINNILNKNTESSGIKPYQLVYRGGIDGIVFDHNNLSSGTGPVNVIGAWQGGGNTLAWFEANYSSFFMNNTDIDPQFVDTSNRDYSLQPSSPMIDAGMFLTTTTSAGSGRVIPVADAGFFHNGFDIEGELGDRVQFEGASAVFMIVDVDYTNHTITLDADATWTNGQGVSLAYNGSAPDLGAFEFSSSVELDTDADGIPDVWEAFYGLDSEDINDALLDADLDGMSNLDEYIAGTDPTDPQSYLQLTQLEHAGESFTLSFLSQLGREYSVGRKFDLQEIDWTIVTSGIAGTGAIIEVEDTADEPAQFYRLNVTIPE